MLTPVLRLGLCRHFPLASNIARSFTTVVKGSKYSTSYENYLKLANGEIASYFHDVPLDFDARTCTANMVVEIPRWTNAKFEIAKDVEFNPIKQDVKNGTLRYVNNIFPFKGYIHNYGALPQTWEDPTHEGMLGLKGDNDPLDCCEIGSAVLATGDIKRVKILGSIALIDDGELDWKLIVLDVNDPLSKTVNDICDVDIKLPGLLDVTKKWFRDYKLPSGKSNAFALNGHYLGVEETVNTIQSCHKSWQKLVSGTGGYEKFAKIKRAGSNITLEAAQTEDSTIPEEVNKWHFV